MKKLVLLFVLLVGGFASAQTYSIARVNGTFTLKNLTAGTDGEDFPSRYIFVYRRGDKAVIVQKNGANEKGRPIQYPSYAGIPITDLRNGNASDAVFADWAAVDAWFKENTGFNPAPGGSGAVPEGYISPLAYGAVMDGVTDDRDAFVATLAAANEQGKKVWIGGDVFLDVDETGTKTIYIDDNTWIEGSSKDVNIILNQEKSPALHFALTEGATVKNITFLYDGSYDASGETNDATVNSLNVSQLKTYLTENKGITFSGSLNPNWTGPGTYWTMFLFDGATDITFENVEVKAKGSTANTFVPWTFNFRSQFAKNQTVSDGSATQVVPKRYSFKNVTMDGTIMGFLGTVQEFKAENITSKRYSDYQTLAGGSIGGYDGSSYGFPPPHLFYFNNNGSPENGRDMEIYNTIDYGEYVGTVNVRPTASGYCNSLKLTTDIENVIVDGYKSYRRDGLGDLQNITNGVFKNIYSESTINIFDPTFSFNSFRFLGTLTNCNFDNIIIRDLSETIAISPLDYSTGSGNTMNNIHVYVKELITTPDGMFGLWGNNNRVVNSGFNIENHSATDTFKAPILHDTSTRNSGSENYYDIYLKGWRPLASNVAGLVARMLVTNSTNPNSNYAKITDVDNNMVIEQVNGTITHKWTRSALATLSSGTNSTLSINVPRYYAAKRFFAETTTTISSGNVSLGIDGANQTTWMPTISNTTGIVRRDKNELIGNNAGNRNIVLFTDGTFSSGVVKITVQLERIFSEGSGINALLSASSE